MKVIDLLNKKANGEEVPEKIKYKDDMLTYYESADEIRKLYIYEKNNVFWFDRDFFNLDTEVELIEEDKEIEEIKINLNSTRPFTEQIEDKLNEIIRNHNKILRNFNELKKGK